MLSFTGGHRRVLSSRRFRSGSTELGLTLNQCATIARDEQALPACESRRATKL